MGFPCGSAGKESACNVGDWGSIPGLERSPGKGKDYTLHYSGLENSIVHGITKSRTDFHFHFFFSKDKGFKKKVQFSVGIIKFKQQKLNLS